MERGKGARINTTAELDKNPPRKAPRVLEKTPGREKGLFGVGG